MFLLFYFLMNVFSGYGGIWLSEWSDSYLIEGKVVDKGNNLLIYAMIGLAQRNN
jgi:hypothetical protein